MSTPPLITTLTVEERTKYDEYTKEQVYEAYMLEVRRSEQLTKDMKSLNRVLARLRFELKEV